MIRKLGLNMTKYLCGCGSLKSGLLTRDQSWSLTVTCSLNNSLDTNFVYPHRTTASKTNGSRGFSRLYTWVANSRTKQLQWPLLLTNETPTRIIFEQITINVIL